ncbi:MAG: Zn-dependent exopeptidase M28 [Anaerolineales bacterium]|nr:Zn-dependent exopeptidase M28 [Anaerolineales bacterium]
MSLFQLLSRATPVVEAPLPRVEPYLVLPDRQAEASLAPRSGVHIAHLVDVIGPRPAGSAEERAAADYVDAQLRAAGYTPERQPVPFAPHLAFTPWFALGGGLLFAAATWLQNLPGLAFVSLIYIIVLPELTRWLSRRRARTAQSQNVIAFTAAPSDAPTLIVCAHLDSAPATALGLTALRALHQQIMFVNLRVAWAVAALAALRLLGLALPELALTFGSAAGIVAGATWLALELGSQLGGPRDFAPGANDNGSGVGVALAVAERIAAQPPSRLRVGFLFTGAEETGLHGAEAFAATVARGQRVAVLNLDMVGSGRDLITITQDGALQAFETDVELNVLIRECDVTVRGRAFRLRSGDHAPFLRRGIRAAALQAVGRSEAELAYHTPADDLSLIDPRTLDRVARLVCSVIDQADVRGYPYPA